MAGVRIKKVIFLNLKRDDQQVVSSVFIILKFLKMLSSINKAFKMSNPMSGASLTVHQETNEYNRNLQPSKFCWLCY